MYGEIGLTPPRILKYGLTKEFFELFSSLQYEGIEIPIVLMRYFQNFIRPFVKEKFHDERFVKQFQEKHQIYSIIDIQKALIRIPEKKEYVIQSDKRKAIMMPTVFIDFAIEHLSDYSVIIVVLNERDRQLLQNKKLPSSFIVCDFYREARKVKIREDVKNQLYQQKKILLKKYKQHELFGKQDFQNWFTDQRIFLAMQWIHYLKEIIVQKNVGLMIDQVEVINPSILYGLFAHQLGIPFILAPQSLLTDRSVIPTRATHYLVWGKYYREWFEKRGIPADRIVEAGNIRFYYELKHQKRISRRRFLNVSKVPEDHIVVSYMTQPFHFEDSYKVWLLKWFIDSVASLPISVIIRPHPFDKFDYRKYIKNNEKIKILTNEKMSLYNLIDHSDAVITISSNTAVEAAILNRAIIALQPKLPYLFEFNDNNINSFLVRGNAGAVAYNKYDLKNHFEKLVNDPKYKKRLAAQGQIFLQNTINQTVTPPDILKKTIDQLLGN